MRTSCTWSTLAASHLLNIRMETATHSHVKTITTSQLKTATIAHFKSATDSRGHAANQLHCHAGNRSPLLGERLWGEKAHETLPFFRKVNVYGAI